MDAQTQAATSNPAADPLLGAVGGVVLDLAPDLGRWLFGAKAAIVVPAVQAALNAITGSPDPAVQAQALADPTKATALRMELARIVAGQAEAVRAERQTALVAQLAATNAQQPSAAASQSANRIGWGAAVVSLVVLLTFAAVVVVALTRTVPAGAEPVLNVLLGTLGAMATSVVGYWVGSSAGSARKEERLASLAERG